MRSLLRFPVLLACLLAFLLPTAAVRGQAPDAPFEPSGKVWGYVFADYFYKFSGDSAWGASQYAATPEGMHAGELRRFYLGYDYSIAPAITSRVLLEANNGTTFANGSYGVFIKLGHLTWTRPANLPITVSVGLVPTPIFTFPEKAWGYRSIEKEALDARGFGSSADQGVLVEGALGAEGSYRFMIGNNSGTRRATDRNKAVYASFSQRFLDKKLSLEVMGTYLPRRDERDRLLGRVFAGYEAPRANLGVEVALIDEGAPADFGGAPGTEVTRLLVSGFASVPIRREGVAVSVFGRYDFYDPDLDFAAGRGYTQPDPFHTEHLLILGLDAAPHPRVHIMPNLWFNIYRARGGVAERATDVVPRLTFYWTFG